MGGPSWPLCIDFEGLLVYLADLLMPPHDETENVVYLNLFDRVICGRLLPRSG